VEGARVVLVKLKLSGDAGRRRRRPDAMFDSIRIEL